MEENSRPSGWERADRVVSGAENVAIGISTVLTKIWALIIIAVCVAMLIFVADKTWWAALIGIAYGIYLLLPGSKWVVW